MKELTLPLMACAVLCFAGCDRKDADATNANASRDPADLAADAENRDIAEQGGRRTTAASDTPSGQTPGTTPAAGTEQRARNEAAQPAAQPTDDDSPGEGEVADAPRNKQEFVAASKRRLEQLERELKQLEARSKERGKQMRAEIREEKRRLDAELDRLDAQSEEAWSDMKQGFANALEKLEGEIRQVRKDVDPDA
jgi:hypothetical protein